jgi:hypothetical protein
MFRFLSVLISFGLMAGTAAAQEREWTLDASDEDAYLVFGVPETDDIGVSLWCPIRKGTVRLFVPRPTEALQKLSQDKVPITVSAGAEQATFAARADVNTEAMLSSLEVEMPAGHPLLKALESADRFSVRIADDEIVFPFYDADLPGLMELCRKD